jgi:hypothetical protein
VVTAKDGVVEYLVVSSEHPHERGLGFTTVTRWAKWAKTAIQLVCSGRRVYPALEEYRERASALSRPSAEREALLEAHAVILQAMAGELAATEASPARWPTT